MVPRWGLCGTYAWQPQDENTYHLGTVADRIQVDVGSERNGRGQRLQDGDAVGGTAGEKRQDDNRKNITKKKDSERMG